MNKLAFVHPSRPCHRHTTAMVSTNRVSTNRVSTNRDSTNRDSTNPIRERRGLCQPNFVPRVGAVRFALSFSILLLTALPSVASGQMRSFPHDEHYLALRIYMQGDFIEAQRAFVSSPFLKSSEGVWVDSIAYHTMIGECLYQMGDLSGALQKYSTALRVYLQYPDWLMRVRLPDTLRPAASARRRGPTWGGSTRPTQAANIPDRLSIAMGNTDEANLQALQQGGVIRSRYMITINAKEIVRCMALALRRRAEILGPAGEHDGLTSSVVTQLSRRPAPRGSWAQAWVGVQLGLAYACKGKPAEATAELQKSLLAGGMDHNLTAVALLELGKLSFQAQEYAAASTYFLEATHTAAKLGQDDVTQYEVVAEAFRWQTICQIITAPRGFSPSLGNAVEWARRGYPIVEASLALSAAENCAAMNEPSRARGYLERAAQAMRRRECLNGELGGRFQFITAQTSYQAGDVQRGASALATALGFQNKASRRLFHIRYADTLFTSGAITTRQASLLYEQVLRDPTSHDWAHDPLESLAVLTVPHVPAFERWMLLALDRKENDNALRISEALRRHRFYTSLPLGGRMLNLRWAIEAPGELLPQDVALRRQDLLNRYPALQELSRQVAQLRAELDALPIHPDDPAVQKQNEALQREIEQASESIERLLQVVAVSREPSEPVFPPNKDVALVQEQLTPEQRALVYVSTQNGVFAFMLGPEEYSTWTLEAPANIRTDVAKMLREMGQYDRNQQIGIEELTRETWKPIAADILKQLTADAPAEAWDEFDELIVVPDGMLWYVPFEALQIERDGEYVPVIDKVRLRYAPTISLTVPDKQPRAREMRTAVVTGTLFSPDTEALSQELLDDLRSEDPNVSELPVRPPPATSVLAKVIDRLIVLDDLNNDSQGPFGWAPMPVDRGRGAGSLLQWMRTPWGGPDQVILPGFHTPAENGLKRGGNGEEMFLAVCGLMSTGTRTILLSRWRDGGRTCHELLREFVRELPHRSASEAWRRSVRLTVNNTLAWSLEPRIKQVPADTAPIKAAHPFFWGGHMLIDSGVVPK